MKPTADFAAIFAMLTLVLAVLVFLGLLIAFALADRRRRESLASYRKPSPLPEFRVTTTEPSAPDDDLQELWTEDAATIGKPGHETIEMAWQRLFGEPEPLIPKSIRTYAIRTYEVRRYPLGRIAMRETNSKQRGDRICGPPKSWKDPR